MNIAPQQLKEFIDYNPETGILTWKHRDIKYFSHCKYVHRTYMWWNNRFEGKIIGENNNQCYIEFSLFKKFVKAHIIAWTIYYGKEPVSELDHINGDGKDNRICNLREVTRSENNKNKKKLSNNTSGVTGVGYDKESKKWRGRITSEGVVFRKRFKTFEEACVWRKQKEKEFGFTERHGT